MECLISCIYKQDVVASVCFDHDNSCDKTNFIAGGGISYNNAELQRNQQAYRTSMPYLTIDIIPYFSIHYAGMGRTT